MIPLPDMLVLDFFEWIKVEFIREQRDVDVLDIILDTKHSYELERYSKNYLAVRRVRHPFKNLLHRFIDSHYFDECLSRCDMINNLLRPFNQDFNNWTRIYPENLWRFLDECYHCRRCYKYLDEFLYECGGFEQNNFASEDIHPYDLACYVRNLIQNGNRDSKTQSFMQTLNIDFTVEIDFLEWLIKEKNAPMNISQMPIEVFEDLVNEYQQITNTREQTKQKLIKSFKQSDNDTFARKLLAVMPFNIAKKAQSLGYVYDRYSNRRIHYRCVILPLGTDEELMIYKTFIKKSWKDLHLMSGNFLDIYYSEVDYGKSGYEILNTLSYMPKNLAGKLPCIVLWKDDMSQARSIHIGRLGKEDIFEVFSKIVSLIEQETPVDKIVKEAAKVRSLCLKRGRPTHTQLINIIGSHNNVKQTFV